MQSHDVELYNSATLGNSNPGPNIRCNSRAACIKCFFIIICFANEEKISKLIYFICYSYMRDWQAQIYTVTFHGWKWAWTCLSYLHFSCVCINCVIRTKNNVLPWVVLFPMKKYNCKLCLFKECSRKGIFIIESKGERKQSDWFVYFAFHDYVCVCMK